jgi:acyl-CoA synthetase (AMP-forming)/AMP-acid ligase II/acyl carrier protein
MIKANSDRDPNALALIAINGEAITFGNLYTRIVSLVDDFNRLGIGRGNRVAVAIPNGPEMAMAFLAVSSAATCAPLNPNFRIPEFDYYLNDLKVSALLLLEGVDTPACESANKLKIPILRLTINGNWSNSHIVLQSGEIPGNQMTGISNSDDIALLLHTSGTTARPKLVPLTQRNICISAGNIHKVLQLTPADRCMNVMPLFHIHGLMAGLCASLLAGGSTVCTPGFYAPDFFDWMIKTTPTWYTAVPTMHQAILERSQVQAETEKSIHLRFMRSSSAPLPPAIMLGLEALFGAPLIEAYGMTEATHQIASNPLPPRPHKPGSVGLPAGPEIALLSNDGSIHTQPDISGEIILRGDNLMPGYLDSSEANTRAFHEGWFRTGDSGHFDPEGYLFITGRLKELINRAGEKISPREIDEVLLEHPAVAQAMAFAIPDPKLGEDVAAAVVLRKPGTTEKELRHFLSTRLSTYKIPVKIVFLEEIPKGPTGKPQRIGMAAKLGLEVTQEPLQTASPVYCAPRTKTEEQLAALWQDVLKIDRVSIRQPFLDLGGDSMTAMQLANRICEWMGTMINLIDFFEAQTIEAQAVMIDSILLESKSDKQGGNGVGL